MTTFLIESLEHCNGRNIYVRIFSLFWQ